MHAIKLTFAAALILLGGAVPAAFAQDEAAAIEVGESQLFYAPRRDTLFVLVDLYPQATELDGMEEEARDAAFVATALAEGEKLVAMPGMEDVANVRIEFGYIKNMDEYARQDFSSMVRHGYVMLGREGADLLVSEDAIDFVSE